MQISSHVDELRRQLLAAAATGGADVQELAERLSTALDAAARLAILEALAEAAGEITRELAPASVDVRLRGRDVEFVVTKPAPAPAAASPAPGREVPVEEGDDGTTSRTTLRLPDSLKSRAEAAAATSGVSLNTWFVRAVNAALEPRRPAPPHGNSYTGWVR